MTALPENLIGNWKCIEFDSNNLDNYLSQLGVSWAIRKVAKKCGQTIKIERIDSNSKQSSTEQSNGSNQGLHIITTTTLTQTDDIFYFNIPRQVTTKDGRKSTVIFKIKNIEDLNIEDEEDKIDLEELEKEKAKGGDYSSGNNQNNGQNSRDSKYYLLKKERWVDSKGKEQSARITMKVTDKGLMYARMGCNGVVVDRLHERS